jgi:hypothetical protein
MPEPDSIDTEKRIRELLEASRVFWEAFFEARRRQTQTPAIIVAEFLNSIPGVR